MLNSFFRKANCFVLFFVLTLTSGYAPADDTEIYFSGGGVVAEARPNVMMILDTSGSMGFNLSGGGGKRMTVMKDALNTIVSGVQDINIGLMRFTRGDGGAVIYPIRYIDEPLEEPSVSVRITDDNDDADEDLATGVVQLHEEVLSITQGFNGVANAQVNASENDADEPGGITDTDFASIEMGGGNTHAGARFTGLLIPPGADITSATLSLVTNDASAGGSVDLSGHLIANSPAFVDATGDISTRPKTVATVNWSPAGGASDTLTTSPDISSIIEEIVADPGVGWSAGNDLSIILHDATASRSFYSFDGTPANAPRLDVTYDTTATAVKKMIALRFTNINIPQGTTITNARLSLTSTTNASGPTSWTVQAETPNANGTSDPFAGTNNELSGRTKTGNVLWSVQNVIQGETFESPNLSGVIQNVISNANWCGGNALTLYIEATAGADAFVRNIASADHSSLSAFAPKLDITFDPATSTGCYKRVVGAQISQNNDDAEQRGDNVYRNEARLQVASEEVGLRFQNVLIPQGADIVDAYIEFTAYGNNTSGNPTVEIRGHDTNNASGFQGGNSEDITDRMKSWTRTTANVSWTTGDWTGEQTYTTPDVGSIVQEIVDRGGWDEGNSMVFTFNDVGSSDRDAYSRDSDPLKAPRLVVTYEGTGRTVKLVRDKILELINELPTSGNTPIVETLYEATRYWRGESVVYGRFRANSSTTRISHIDSYTGGTVFYPSGCSEDNLDSSNCEDQEITTSPTPPIYISPFTSDLTCQSNYQVLLTDGEANDNSIANTVRTTYLGGAACRTKLSVFPPGGNNDDINSGENCGIDLVEYLADNDQSSAVLNDQFVRTYTIGFDLGGDADSTQWLRDMADAGKAQFFGAGSSDALISAFQTFLGDVKSDPTSFVAPSLATNSFNRLLSRDEAYFGLFTPSFNVRWPGNLKKYKICIDSTQGCDLGEILDAGGSPAVDPVTNRFLDSSSSIWTTGIDGRETTLGGVGGEMLDFNDRVIYTDTTSTGAAPGSGASLDTADFKLTSTNWSSTEMQYVRNAVCPTPSTSAGSQCEELMLWMLGKIVTPNTDEDPSATTRWTVNDVLHSSPVVVTYGGADSNADGVFDVFYDKVIFGTNEGGLRMANGSTGKEEWTFMPQMLLSNQNALLNNTEGPHIYGIDTTPTLRVVDNNRNGTIEPSDGDLVHVYAAMRMGGNNIYALDLTASVNSNNVIVPPKFLWRIEGGTNTSMGDYTRLNQTWSAPKLARINTTSGIQNVLIFGGGYDMALEDGFGTEPTGGSDNLGNAIFVANADTGELIFSIGGSGSGADITMADMHYSIPSDVTVFDSDGDSVHDRIYVGDTAGQVWRVDLASNITLSGSGREGDSVVGRLATISGTANPEDKRRFFEPPSVVQVKDAQFSDAAGGEYDYVLIGTGYRSHPLDKTVHDRFYAFRDKTIGTMNDGNGDNRADGYGNSGTPIGNSDLIDITSQVLDPTNPSHKQALGWYFDFTSGGGDGEKVLSAPVTIAGGVFFTTYEPTTISADPCQPNIGGGFAYNFNILSTKAFLDWDGDGTVSDFDDRKLALGGGIPSDIVPVFTKEGVVGIVGIEGGAAQLGTLAGLPRYRTYWYEEN